MQRASASFTAAAAGLATACQILHDNGQKRKRSQQTWLGASQFVLAENVRASRIQDVLQAQPLTADDKNLVRAALETVRSEAIEWISKPNDWWENSKTVHMRGLAPISVRSTPVLGYSPPLFLGQVIVKDVTWGDLAPLVELREGCEKFEKDPVMNKMSTLTRFPSTIDNARGEVLRHPELVRLHSNSNLCGLISAREIDEWSMQFRFPDGKVSEHCCGLHSKKFQEYAQKSTTLKALMEAPVSAGHVRSFDHNSGCLIEPWDDDASAGRPGSWRVSTYILTEVNGKIPDWAAREACKKTLVDYLTFLQKELAAKTRA